MEYRPVWPQACRLRLLELATEYPPLSATEIGHQIAQMPEAKAIGFLGTKDAVLGKIWRLRKRYGPAIIPKPKQPEIEKSMNTSR